MFSSYSIFIISYTSYFSLNDEIGDIKDSFNDAKDRIVGSNLGIKLGMSTTDSWDDICTDIESIHVASGRPDATSVTTIGDYLNLKVPKGYYDGTVGVECKKDRALELCGGGGTSGNGWTLLGSGANYVFTQAVPTCVVTSYFTANHQSGSVGGWVAGRKISLKASQDASAISVGEVTGDTVISGSFKCKYFMRLGSYGFGGTCSTCKAWILSNVPIGAVVVTSSKIFI